MVMKYKIIRISKIATGVGFVQNLPEGQYSEKICETLFDTGNDKEDAANSEKYARLICDALNASPSAPSNDYWKKRCEVVESFLYEHEPFHHWQKCPVCYGEKTTHVYNDNSGITWSIPIGRQICSVCNGWGILDTNTGLPPQPNSEQKDKRSVATEVKSRNRTLTPKSN